MMLQTTTLLVLLCLTTSITADDTPPNYFQILIREIDNPSGALQDGTPCSNFNFLNIGCNTYLRAGVSLTGSDNIDISDAVLLNSNGETRLSNLNLVYADNAAGDAVDFTGFTFQIFLTSDSSFDNIIDNYTVQVNSTLQRGIYTYTSQRSATLPTTISLAWATNIQAPATTTAGPTTTSGSPGTTASPTTTEEPTTTPRLPRDCAEIPDVKTGGNSIYPDGSTAVQVYCDVTSYGTYTTIQSRGNGDQTSFDVPYDNYTRVIGTPGANTNFWLGLENMNVLSQQKTYALQIDLCCGGSLIAKQIYHNFKVGDVNSTYSLSATGDLPGIGLDYSSDGKDLSSIPFATNATYVLPGTKASCDELAYESDAGTNVTQSGGWWYGSCGNNLNGQYLNTANTDTTCKIKNFDSNPYLGVNLRTTTGASTGGWDVDLISYDRVRMAIFSFDSILINRGDDSICTR